MIGGFRQIVFEKGVFVKHPRKHACMALLKFKSPNISHVESLFDLKDQDWQMDSAKFLSRLSRRSCKISRACKSVDTWGQPTPITIQSIHNSWKSTTILILGVVISDRKIMLQNLPNQMGKSQDQHHNSEKIHIFSEKEGVGGEGSFGTFRGMYPFLKVEASLK